MEELEPEVRSPIDIIDDEEKYEIDKLARTEEDTDDKNQEQPSTSVKHS